MLYNKKVQRWSIGIGNVLHKHRPDYSVVYDQTSKGPVEFSGFLRASVQRLGKKNFKVILFQGKDHKDTIYKTKRWMNVRETIGNHLCDIDRYLERPLTKFRMPTEEECFGPRVGDIIVYKGNYEFLYGALGEILEVPGDKSYWNKKYGENGVTVAFGLDSTRWVHLSPGECEIIDHIDEPQFKVSPPDPSSYKKASEELLEQKHQTAREQMLQEADRLVEELPKIPISQSPSDMFEEDGWEYWLEKSSTRLCLKRRCKSCKTTASHAVKDLFLQP